MTRKRQAVAAMVAEVRHRRVKARDRRHEAVVDPNTAHRVVDRRIDLHRPCRGHAGDLLVHLEQVAVAPVPCRVSSRRLGGVGKTARPVLLTP